MKPLQWMGSSKKDLKEMPKLVQNAFGYALSVAQRGQTHKDAKPLKGFGSAAVLEILERDESGTYRAVYTVKIKEAVYVLHCFQKKSKSGIATPKADVDLIKLRLKQAEALAKEADND